MRKSLHPMLMLVIIVLLCWLSTFILPAGAYDHVYFTSAQCNIVIPESFHYVTRTPLSPGKLLTSVTMGLQEGSPVIFFLMIAGGMFGILGGTGTLSVAIAGLMKKLKDREWLMIPIFMLLFGAGSTFCGNFEEFLVFIPLILACCITAGYDSLTAVGIIYLAATAGYAGAVTNAFTLGTAQKIAELEVFSGMGLRIAVFIVMEAISIAYVMWYARFIKKNPKLSGVFEYDAEYNADKKFDLEKVPALTVRQKIVLLIFILGMLIAVWGIVKKGFYVNELSAVFLAIGIIGGIAGGLRPGAICERFVAGCRSMILPCLMIGLAHSAVYILEHTNVMDSLLHSMAALLSRLPSSLMACGMFVFHGIFNVFVPSGSAQAAATMPLMTPLADANEVSRQTAVLAYLMGDAFTNVLAPTGGVILAALAFCRVPFGKWVRFLLPLFIIWCIAAFAFLMYAGGTGY